MTRPGLPLLFCVVLLQAGCFWIPLGCGEREERYFAVISVNPDHQPPGSVVTFNRKLSECVNGIENDDFAWTPVEVEKAMFGESVLYPSKLASGPVYSNGDVIEIEKDVLTSRISGRIYMADLSTVKGTGNGVKVDMRRLPAK